MSTRSADQSAGDAFGGGVSDVIPTACGPRLKVAAKKKLQAAPEGRLPVDSAVETPAYNLEKHGVQAIIHAVNLIGIRFSRVTSAVKKRRIFMTLQPLYITHVSGPVDWTM